MKAGELRHTATRCVLYSNPRGHRTLENNNILRRGEFLVLLECIPFASPDHTTVRVVSRLGVGWVYLVKITSCENEPDAR